MMIRKQKVKNLKRSAAPINYRSLSVDQFGKLVTDYSESLDKRIVKGYLVIWNTRNSFGEKFIKGCFAKSIQEHGPNATSNYKIKFLNQHKQSEACALFKVLREDETGLYFETVPLDDVPWANELLTQLRSGTINNFSIGFDYVWDKIEYDDKDDSLVMIEAILMEGSAVTIPADMGTYAVRGMIDLADLHDAIENFINVLPRANRLQARKLFADQKSLIPKQPLEQRATTLNKDKPTKKKAINVNYILNNVKF